MDRSGETLAAVDEPSLSLACKLATNEFQSLTQSSAAAIASPSTGEACVGVGGAWQQTQVPGIGQPGPCEFVDRTDVRQPQAELTQDVALACCPLAFAAHGQQQVRPSHFAEGLQPVK
jgi:hypothetical protein